MAADFDLRALHAVLDAERAQRSLSWTALARELGVSAATLRRLGERPSAEGDGVLRALAWLGRTAESFVPGGAGRADGSSLRSLGPPVTLRFDAVALYAALDAARAARGMTWGEVAGAIGAKSAGGLTRLRAGGRVAFPEVMRILAWLGAPAIRFARPTVA